MEKNRSQEGRISPTSPLPLLYFSERSKSQEGKGERRERERVLEWQVSL